MLSSHSLAFLRKLLDTPGPSGFESAAATVWRDEAATLGTVTADVTGNSIAIVNAGAPITVMLAGHIDEIGVIVTWIDDEGFAWIGPIGGWDSQVLVGQRIRFAGRGESNGRHRRRELPGGGRDRPQGRRAPGALGPGAADRPAHRGCRHP
jgi:endoglucanase